MAPLVTALLIACLIPPIASAHHAAGAVYDMANISEVAGEVVAISWRNPHIHMTLRVAGQGVNEQGSDVEWNLEAGAINTVSRMGVTTDDIHVGDEIRVAGHLARDGQLSMFVSNALTADGRELFLLPASPRRWPAEALGTSEITAAAAAEAELQADGLFRVWTRLLSVPPLREATLTAKAEAGKSQWDPVADNPTLRCERPGMIEAMVTPSPIALVRDGENVIIQMEEFDQTRTVHMVDLIDLENVDPASVDASPLGYSTGVWDSDDLVVNTSRINWPYSDDEGTPQSEAVTIVERFSMHADGMHMTWEGRVTDAENLVGTALIREEYVWVPGEQIKRYDCAL